MRSNETAEYPPPEESFWPNFEYLPLSTVGYFAKTDGGAMIVRPDIDAITSHLGDFFKAAGIDATVAIPKPVGAVTGIAVVAALGKLVGPSISVAKFVLGWTGRIAAIRRREQLPEISVTILADHMPPVKQTPTVSFDSARTLCLVLPELQSSLESKFPTFWFRITVLARASNIERVVLRLQGLPLSDRHINDMLKMLNGDHPSLTVFHTKGWFAYPKVTGARAMALPRTTYTFTTKGG